MIVIQSIRISEVSIEYLKKRRLEKQYLKAKKLILAGRFSNVDLKIREPKKERIWYFRINKQFRALCELEGDILYVLAIDNHQK
ncbi:MAG: hypothetical protein PHU93_01370 [Candidatus Gracilibacteria bacterium]|nr:hypothetical protein [Candidatus Gracilibacteria bacterium]